MRRLRESFRPEFLNRIDEIIIFRQLDEAQLRQITELLLEETRRRLHAQDVTLEFTPAAVDWIAEHGYQPEFGARPMRRTIQREVDNQLSRLLLDGQISPGQDGHRGRRGRPADLHRTRPAGSGAGQLSWAGRTRLADPGSRSKIKIKGTQRKARHGTRKLQARSRA